MHLNVDIERVQRITWTQLLACKIRSFPVDLGKLYDYNKIELRLVDNLVQRPTSDYFPKKRDVSYSFLYNGAFVVLRERNIDDALARYAEAHELGHILLGHVTQDNENEIKGLAYHQREDSADLVAYHLLAPCCLLRNMDSITVASIADEFRIPDFVAYKCMAELKEYYLDSQGLFIPGFKSPLEEKLFNQVVKKRYRKFI